MAVKCLPVALGLLLCASSSVLADPIDVNIDVKVPGKTRILFNFVFTGGVDADGNTIVLKETQVKVENFGDDEITQNVQAKAPTGTKDRALSKSTEAIAAIPSPETHESAAILPPVEPPFADWLAANGFFTGIDAFQTPLYFGDVNVNGIFDGLIDVGLYALNFDRDAFLPFADETNFALGSSGLSPVGGLIFPGLRLFSDAALTAPYAGPVVVGSILSESVPEPTSLLLLATGGIGLIIRYRRKSQERARSSCILRS